MKNARLSMQFKISNNQKSTMYFPYSHSILLGSLEDLIEEMKREKKQFNTGKLEYMVISLFDGLNCFHQASFLHQNIKLSNILLKDNQFKYSTKREMH